MSNALLVPGPVRRIAILRALFLGDLLCATPAFRALRRRFPAAEIALIGLPWAAAFVARAPALDRLVPFPGYPGIAEGPRDPALTAAFLAEARAHGYDLALQLHGDGRSSNGFVAELGAPRTLGYRPGAAPDPRLTRSLPYLVGEHEVRRWVRVLAPLGIAPEPSPRPDLDLTAADIAGAAALLAGTGGGGPLVGLHVGAKEEGRRWPIAHFAAVAERLVARHDARIVLTGGESERPLTEALRRAARVPLLDLAGRTDLGQFAAVIAALDLLVTNDTGASHLAAATGTRSVVLFGPSRPAEWAPLDGARHIALAGAGDDPATALRRLPPGPVLAACFRQLSGRRPRPAAAPAAVISGGVAAPGTSGEEEAER